MKTFLQRFGPILAIIACLCLCLTIPGHAQTRPDTGPQIVACADCALTNYCAGCPDNCCPGCDCGCCCLIVKPCAATDPFPSIEGSLSVTHSLNPDNWRFDSKSTALGLDVKIKNLLGPVALIGDVGYSLHAENPFAINDHWSAGLEVPLDKSLSLSVLYQDGMRDGSLFDNRVLLGAKLKFGG
jgi:hypothetical protein